MIINKDYMKIMRSSKQQLMNDFYLQSYNIRKQNEAGLIVGVCMLLAGIVIVCGILGK